MLHWHRRRDGYHGAARIRVVPLEGMRRNCSTSNENVRSFLYNLYEDY